MINLKSCKSLTDFHITSTNKRKDPLFTLTDPF